MIKQTGKRKTWKSLQCNRENKINMLCVSILVENLDILQRVDSPHTHIKNSTLSWNVKVGWFEAHCLLFGKCFTINITPQYIVVLTLVYFPKNCKHSPNFVTSSFPQAHYKSDLFILIVRNRTS